MNNVYYRTLQYILGLGFTADQLFTGMVSPGTTIYLESFRFELRVGVHARDRMADMSAAKAVSVSQGSKATIHVSSKTRQRLSTPFTNCTYQQYLEDEDDMIKYTVDMCTSFCFQHEVCIVTRASFSIGSS